MLIVSHDTKAAHFKRKLMSVIYNQSIKYNIWHKR